MLDSLDLEREKGITILAKFRLAAANEALRHLRAGELHGSAVLKIG